MPSATLEPTPWTDWSSRNHSRSESERKPNRRIMSSRTWVSMDKTAASPVGGRFWRVREEQWTT